jgi:hypothetical protein
VTGHRNPSYRDLLLFRFAISKHEIGDRLLHLQPLYLTLFSLTNSHLQRTLGICREIFVATSVC